MDLKQFATLQKIQGKSELLRYVMSHDDVPVSEIEKAFGSLIVNEESPVVDAVFDDYGAFLQKQTRLGVVPLAHNTFEVSGDIDTNLVDTIGLLSGDSQEDIVNNLVFTVMSEIRGSSDLEISDIQITNTGLDSAVNKVLTKAEEALERFKSGDFTLDDLNNENVNFDKLEKSNDDELEEFNDDELEDLNDDELEELNDDELEELNDDELEEPADNMGEAEKELAVIDFDSLNDSVDFGGAPEVGNDDSEHVESDIEPEVPTDSVNEQQPTAQVIQKIYDKVVDELRARDLDKRLGLTL